MQFGGAAVLPWGRRDIEIVTVGVVGVGGDRASRKVLPVGYTSVGRYHTRFQYSSP